MDDFKVEVDVKSYFTSVDGRKVYTRGKTWSFMCGRNLSVAHIKAAVEEKFRWSDDQRMTIWYGNGDATVPLISESEIALLLFACSSTKFLRFGVTIESKQQPNEPAPVMAEDDDDQPVRAPFFAWPKQAYAREYEDDEQVGCDGESTYLQEEDDGSNENAKPQKNAEPEVVATRVPLGTLDVDNSYDPQHVQGDDESLLGNNVCPTHLHDKSNPRIAVGATFPDSKAFKVALRQLAIREDWSFETEYSEPQRFRAKCTDKDCPWRSSPNLAEISGNGWRHVVDLEKKECSCRRWQICGKPCTHALRFIFSKQAKLEEYVDEFFSVARFRAAYEGVLVPIRGRSQWPKVNPGFDMVPPKLTKSAGRPRTRRIKNYTEGGTGRKHKCKRCGAIGHMRKTCTEKEIESDADRDATPSPRKKTKTEASIATTPPMTPTKTPTKQGIPTSPMTRQRAAAIAIANSPPSACTRSKNIAPSPLRERV